MKVYHWSGARPWELAGTVTSRDAVGPDYAVTVEGVSDYSPFVLTSGEGPTDVALHNFAAQTGIGWGIWSVLILALVVGALGWGGKRSSTEGW
jgi:hypothetical protein